ncbi:PREDICTED: uncharacterized protein LOC107092058 [Cyprinodon variegatus]|uniref:uncharacterized protein LOC107092058 n=1 Tax=Cyprinodon variegatus TaxID=28743 RepID=UPI00074263B1|nr:PREDICTED: uncharacterized protein LOC107092058 [Cyprinodon variegatus]XP_015241826.1 PREDICTED: uncharacterized protein LOC107092058 [Cyprinodon variegatus]
MVTMFSLRQAALVLIHLMKIQSLFEVSATQTAHFNKSVSSGDPVTFTCNISGNTTKEITWTDGRYHFVNISQNQTFSNFSTERVKIDSEMPSKFIIFRAQHNDAGFYTCSITDTEGVHENTWNLTVSESNAQNSTVLERKGINFSRHVFFILSPSIGLILCCFMLVVCLCRNCRRRRKSQHLGVNQYIPTDPSDSSDCWRSKQQRKGYIERMNSIYGYF